ncbi:cation transporter [Carboxydothermus hydrogenoformans]|uniref:Copper chaperone CopZ n=1 Tax=Carboxydothermus hydrogenoformans (strain ATCC BAA-161 / DSM 6008 / Z-2901) TaxID=246194 RepID=Q3ADJ8_CARHZ|nr:cation transporter [Carboxydothermus hydrogenoformans]ABB13708.1 heavy-metal-associated domain protein [Carboxydothermus hydrogenoformans Z-2901]
MCEHCGAHNHAAEQTVVLKVDGMTCNHCKMSVEKALYTVNGVKMAAVNLAEGLATVLYDPNLATVEQMKAAVEKAGYEVVGVQ